MVKRCDILDNAVENPVGVELGVAEGVFSEMVLANKEVGHWFSIDAWAGDRGHDTAQYKTALRKLLPYADRNTVLRMRFADALDLFPDEFFDFIYVDGYAHTGQDNGHHLESWWPKLKVGGVFAGDDYDKRWHKNMKVVDKFLKKKRHELRIHDFDENKSGWSASPSWFTIKVR